jgi:hypothetical protein
MWQNRNMLRIVSSRSPILSLCFTSHASPSLVRCLHSSLHVKKSPIFVTASEPAAASSQRPQGEMPEHLFSLWTVSRPATGMV